jgi:hypothetical protein
MPYITQERREELDPLIDELFNNLDAVKAEGEINYCCTRLVHLYVLRLIKNVRKSYQILGQGHKILTEAAREYYRVVMGGYEDEARQKNGSVSELDGEI